MEDNKNCFLVKSDNVNFKSYIDAVKEKKITWDLFVQLMDDLSTNMNRQKLLISILLQEFKTFINYRCQCQLQGKSKHFDDCNPTSSRSTIQDSVIQKSTFQDYTIHESGIIISEEEKSNFEDNPISESMIEESTILESTLIHEEEEKSNGSHTEVSSTSNITFEEFMMTPLENEIGEEGILKNDSNSGNLGRNHDDIPIHQGNNWKYSQD